MIKALSVTLILIAVLFVSTSCQNCSDVNCDKCQNPEICDLCKTNYILIDSICAQCISVFPNCNICNDTILPLQCVSCSKGFYSNTDFTTCDTCSNLIENCTQCQFQAPFQRVQCNQCVDDWYVSDDKYSCIEPISVAVIIIVAVVVGVVILGLAGFFLSRWLKKRNLENPLLQEEEYQKAV